jgi:hypothetical protein
LEALLLIGGGVLAVVLHRAFDLSLGIPGHHGIEWIALLTIGRATSRFRGAGSLTSMGASLASTLPFLHAGNPYTPLFYLIPGPLMDAAFRYLPRVANKLWFMILLGGLAHATKPIGQITLNLLTGWPFGSFRYGFLVPFSNHLLFGMIGGLLGGLLILGIRHASTKPLQ